LLLLEPCGVFQPLTPLEFASLFPACWCPVPTTRKPLPQDSGDGTGRERLPARSLSSVPPKHPFA
jgi:hypothetical protein